MPEPASHKIPINLNLLKPQSESPKNYMKFFHWVLFAGRYIVIVVEIIVLAAFLARFKLDGDIAATQELIDEQAAYITSLKDVETEVRQIQFQIENIKTLQGSVPDFATVLSHVANQIPTTVKLANLTVEAAQGNSTIRITGEAQNNNEVSAFTQALKGDSLFSDVTLTSIGFEQNTIKFVITTIAIKPAEEGASNGTGT
jgi:Tfp pilus assembly protein PilN